jgi:hypothetical protein
MSSTTGEHIDELQARRKRRERRQPTADAGAKPQTGAAARDLLRDLLTGGPDAGDGTKSPDSEQPKPVGGDEAPTATVPPVRVHPAEPTVPDSEGVDELVRRVQAGTEAAAARASGASGRRRPKGTADLSADAVPQRRPTRRASLTANPARVSRAASTRRRGWTLTLLCALALGVAIAMSLGHARSRLVGTHRAAVAPTTFGAPSLSALIAIPNTIGAVVHRLEAATAGRTVAVKHARRATKHPRARVRRHTVQATGAAPAQQSAPVADTTSSGVSSPRPTYTSPPAASTSQSSSTGASSSSRSGQSAGPTNAGPLGGIGSCVKGC